MTLWNKCPSSAANKERLREKNRLLLVVDKVDKGCALYHVSPLQDPVEHGTGQ